MFDTSKGKLTGAELARSLSQCPDQRMDIASCDGTFEAKVRGGGKSIVSGEADKVARAVEIQRNPQGTGQGGGGLASKSNSFQQLDVGASSLSPELRDAMPLLREVGEAGVVEVLQGWLQAPAKSRVRGGREHRVLKGVTHLSALRATQSFDEVRDGEQTLTRHGERVDFIVGRDLRAPLNPLRTIVKAAACGGLIDDRCEVREVRVTVDAPHLTFVMDGSGSMAIGNRLLAATASAHALAEYYGPRGSTFGYIVLTGDKPFMHVTPGETDAERVVDAILSLETNWGTAYAPAIELAIRASLPNTTILVFGDFEDSGLLSAEAQAIKSEKQIRIVGITDATGCVSYAAELCDEVQMVDMNDPAQVALVCLKAATDA